MKIGIACGGTGGHIFPGLATAAELRRRGHEVLLFLAGKEGEGAAVAGWDGRIVTASFSGFGGLGTWRAPLVLLKLLQAVRHCRAVMRSDRPVVLLAMGSYASLAPVRAARSLGVRVVLHEANVIPGRAVAFLSRWAEAVAVGFAETRGHLKHRRLAVTGMPLRRSSEQEAEGGEQWAQLAPDRFTLLIMGGSRGAHCLNELGAEAVIRLHRDKHAIQVIHLAGRADEALVRARYAQAGVPHAVFAFTADMETVYRRANMAVCRAGASTCAELCRAGLPALLVPYPFAARRHQSANARALAAAGAADAREESGLSAEWLANYLAAALANPERLENMRRAARARHGGNAAAALADLVEQVGRGSG